MKTKTKLLALIYSLEDQLAMSNWQTKYASDFEIVEWSNPLTVPIQSAVAHFCETENIDGLLIDAHDSYDSIVLRRLDDLLTLQSMLLFSTTNEATPVIGCLPEAPVMMLADEQSKLFVIASNDPQSSAKLARVAV